MNPIQKEHRVRCSNHYSIRDSFNVLWKMMASQQTFLKLIFSHENPTKDEIDTAIRHTNGAASPYSMRVFTTYDVIYKKGNTIIITNKPIQSFGRFFAVEDSDWSNRYFIGFGFPVGGAMESITGMMVYFNEDGYCHADHTIIYDRILLSYDLRNGKIDDTVMALYHQTLFIFQVQRDTRELIFYLTRFSYALDGMEETVMYYTNVTMMDNDEKWIHMKRFIAYEIVENKCLVVDLGSLEVGRDGMMGLERRESYFVFHTYILENMRRLEAFLEAAYCFPEREFTDGYPIECIKCGRQTAMATFSYKDSPMTLFESGLGNSYCNGCHIRFSHSKGAWVCSKITTHGVVCNGFLQGEWECSMDSGHSCDQSCIVLMDGCQHKYPYRAHIRLQWIPSADAKEVARWYKVHAPLMDDTDHMIDYGPHKAL